MPVYAHASFEQCSAPNIDTKAAQSRPAKDQAWSLRRQQPPRSEPGQPKLADSSAAAPTAMGERTYSVQSVIREPNSGSASQDPSSAWETCASAIAAKQRAVAIVFMCGSPT